MSSKLPHQRDGKIKLGLLISIFAGMASIAVVGGWLFSDYFEGVPDNLVAEYVGRDSCIQCHETQHALFEGSHHDKAMDLATDETVLADFNDQKLKHYGIESRFFRDGKRFMVNTEGPDGKMADFEVKYVFGYEPLQQYMVEITPSGDGESIGEVQVLRLSWDTKAKKWFYLKPPDVDEKLKPGDPLHWTGITQNWNSSCAFCHSTDLKKNFDVNNDRFNTTFAEIDVSCEACHGPGSVHVQLADKKKLNWNRKVGLGLHKLKTESNLAQVETCAPCHSRRREIADGYYAGCNINDYFETSLMAPGLYHCDGQIRDEVYVYGSFIQSKMYHQNIKCTDCHDPHSLKLKHDGNKLCTSCHQHPAAKYDSPSHHFHKPGTPGSFCVDCHMPATTYMAVDARRDHSLRVPRPDLSLTTNAPNACSGCHLDKSKISDEKTRGQLNQYLDWIIQKDRGNKEIEAELRRVDQQMVDALNQWFPNSEKPDHYAGSFDKAWKGTDDSTPELRKLVTRKSTPFFVRASAAMRLANNPDKVAYDTAVNALEDENQHVVKASLLRVEVEITRIMGVIDSIDQPSRLRDRLNEAFENVIPLTGHQSLGVRIEAARVLLNIPMDWRQRWSSAEQNKSFQIAFDEMIKSLEAVKERGSAHRTLGSIYETVGEIEKAIEHYRIAIRIEDQLQGPRWNLAVLLERQAERLAVNARQLGQNGLQQQAQAQMQSAQELLAEAQEHRNDEHEILLNDLKALEAVDADNGALANLHYMAGMSFYRRNELDQTEVHLNKAYELMPRTEQYVLAMATFYHARQDKPKALRFVTELIQINGRNQGYRNLKAQIEQLR